MPQVINGIGTWYHGKSNIFKQFATCEHCGKYGEQFSYDTRNFFVFLFIPILSLGKKRILYECPHCKMHRLLSQKEWEKQKEENLRRAGERLKSDTLSAEEVQELLYLFLTYQEPNLFEQIAPQFANKYGTDAEVQKALGTVYFLFRNYNQAILHLEQAQAKNDTLDNREILAEAYCNTKKPQKAQPLLMHILEQREENKLWYINLLIESYQACGMHHETLDLIEKVETAFPPSLASLASIYEDKEISQRYRGTNTPVVSEQIEANNRAVLLENHELSNIPTLVFPAIILLALLLYLGSAVWIGTNRTVELINGLQQAYSVTINDKSYKLTPLSREKISLSEGAIVVQKEESAIEEFLIETNFWSRPFSKHTFIINPDHQALLYKEQIIYSVNPTGRDNPYTTYSGKGFYHFTGIDYPFKQPPEEITLDSDGNREVRSYLGFISNFEKSSPLHYAYNMLDSTSLIDYLKYNALNHKSDNNAITLYSTIAQPKEVIESLKLHLNDKPILIEWHRIYQNLMEVAYPQKELKEEYQKRLAQEPDNSVLLYLLGRIYEGAEAENYYLRATRSDSPTPYAYNALAYNALMNNSYKDALSLIGEALKLTPNNSKFSMIEEEALLAMEMYKELLDNNKKELVEDSLNYGLREKRVIYLALNGQRKEAQQEIDKYCKELEKQETNDVKSYRTHLEAQLAYVTNNLAYYSLIISSAPTFNFYQTLTKPDISKAAHIMEENNIGTAYTHLLLYITASTVDKNSEIATKSLEKAIEEFSQGGKDERFISQALSTGSFTYDEVRSAAFMPDYKAIIVAALGIRNPTLQKELFSYGQKQNYSPQPPHHLLTQVFSKKY